MINRQPARDVRGGENPRIHFKFSRQNNNFNRKLFMFPSCFFFLIGFNNKVNKFGEIKKKRQNKLAILPPPREGSFEKALLFPILKGKNKEIIEL